MDKTSWTYIINCFHSCSCYGCFHGVTAKWYSSDDNDAVEPRKKIKKTLTLKGWRLSRGPFLQRLLTLSVPILGVGRPHGGLDGEPAKEKERNGRRKAGEIKGE